MIGHEGQRAIRAHAVALGAGLGLGEHLASFCRFRPGLPAEQLEWIFTYAGGLAQSRLGGAAPQAIPWEQLGPVVHRHRFSRYNGGLQVSGLQVTGQDGTRIAADAGCGAEQLSILGRHVDTVLAGLRLPGVIAGCLRGTPARFGRITVSLDGLGWETGTMHAAWADIRSLRVERHLVSISAGGWRQRRLIFLNGVPDSCVALLLIEELARRLQILRRGPALELDAGQGR